MPRTKDISGMRFGKLTVIKEADNSTHKKNVHVKWVCPCDCGNTKEIRGSALRSGKTVSCGCYGVDARRKSCTKHGLWKNRLYGILMGMKQRCYNPNTLRFDRYGGRGITICDEWMSENGLSNFYKWAMENGYKDGLTIDRIDCDGNYEPSNCRWATSKEQSRNRAVNKYVTYKGETHCLSEWAELYGLKKTTLLSRLYKGWDFEESLTTPIKSIRHKWG